MPFFDKPHCGRKIFVWFIISIGLIGLVILLSAWLLPYSYKSLIGPFAVAVFAIIWILMQRGRLMFRHDDFKYDNDTIERHKNDIIKNDAINKVI